MAMADEKGNRAVLTTIDISGRSASPGRSPSRWGCTAAIAFYPMSGRQVGEIGVEPMVAIGAPGGLWVDRMAERRAERTEVEPRPALVVGLGHVAVPLRPGVLCALVVLGRDHCEAPLAFLVLPPEPVPVG